MVIYQRQFTKQGSNTAVIAQATDWASALRVRMDETEFYRYGGCNSLRIINSSAKDVRVSFSMDVAMSNSEVVKANSVHNITVEDGRTFYGFDVFNLSAAGGDVAIGDIQYTMSRVIQIPERS